MKQPITQQSTRRTVLGAIGTVGLAGVGTAQSEHERGRGAETRNERAADERRPTPHEFECPDGMELLGSFEFVTIEDADGELLDCYFEQDNSPFHITITSYDTKDGEACEPITVYYESARHNVDQVASFGASDSHVDADPEGGIYESELQTPGGQQAAVSLLHFCGTERRTDDDGAVDDESDNNETDDGSN